MSWCVQGRSVTSTWRKHWMEEGLSLHVIGGAQKAAELDAKYAIREGSELAARL